MSRDAIKQAIMGTTALVLLAAVFWLPRVFAGDAPAATADVQQCSTD